MLEDLLGTIFQTKNILENLVKVAVVKTYKPETHTAVVQFKDHDEILSKELPILTPFTQNNKAYFPLAENQKVIVLFLPTGENTDGFIIGTLFDKDNPPPVKDRNKFHIKFEDGTTIEYDKNTHKLKAVVNGDIEITANNTNITTVTTHNGDVVVNGGLIVKGNITASGQISDLGGAKGSLSELRDIYNSHTHPGDSGGDTGTPNQTVGV